jgi:hypothetical protein
MYKLQGVKCEVVSTKAHESMERHSASLLHIPNTELTGPTDWPTLRVQVEAQVANHRKDGLGGQAAQGTNTCYLNS